MQMLCVLGSINIDHVMRVSYFPQAGETIIGKSYQLAYGGKGANQAVAAARLGADVQFIAAIGADQMGQTMKNAFAADGINTQGIITIEQQNTGLAMIQVADNGENNIAIHAGANAALGAEKVIAQQSMITESAMLLTQLETPVDAILKAVTIAKQAGKTTLLNPAPAQALPSELLKQIDIITPNETETQILTGIAVHDEGSAAQAANILHRQGINIVIITLGAKGAYLSQQNTNAEMITGFQVEAIDSTAAGDTFNGALATALLEGKDMRDAIRFAHAAAALSVTKLGAQNAIPYRQEVEEFLVRHTQHNADIA